MFSVWLMKAARTRVFCTTLALCAAVAHGARLAAPQSRIRCAARATRSPARLCAPVEAPELDTFGSAPLLPLLSVREELRLREGERVEHVVMPRGSTGSGLSVQDVRANAADVFRAVSSFGEYASLIKTVRNVSISAHSGTNTKALIEVSRFKLKLYVNFTTYGPAQYVAWTLDRDRPTPFIRECVGYWYVEDLGEARPGWTRVWFVVRVRLRPFVPKIIEMLVARVGLRRATTWIQLLSTDRPQGGEIDGDESAEGSAEEADAVPRR